jgi:acetylornithine deacetylase
MGDDEVAGRPGLAGPAVETEQDPPGLAGPVVTARDERAGDDRVGHHHVPPPGGPELLAAALRWLDELVAQPTVTFEPNLALIAAADAHLRAHGATTTITHAPDGRRANLFATFGPSIDGGVVLSGHTDVVPASAQDWGGDPFRVRRITEQREDGPQERLYGRGTADMKGFIACVLAMAPVFAAAPLVRPVHVALTFDEEVGCLGAPVLLDELARTGPLPAVAIVGEPTSMALAYGHKGCFEFTTTLTGMEGHGSAPELGCNAITWASRYLDELAALGARFTAAAPDGSPFDPPGTTINVGTIHGGAARNVIAGACAIEWELRPVTAADAREALAAVDDLDARIHAGMRAQHPDAGLTRETVGAVGGLEPRGDSAALELVGRLLAGLGGRGERGAVRAPEVMAYNTEAGLFQAAGIDAVLCGPGSIEVAHQPDEFVTLDQLTWCLELLQALPGELMAVRR